MAFAKTILLSLLLWPAISAGDTCEAEGGCEEEGFVQLPAVARHEQPATVQAANSRHLKETLMPIGYRKTRFGHVHEDCMLEVKSGSAVKELKTGEVQITYGDGSVETQAACLHPILNSKLHPSPHAEKELLKVHHGKSSVDSAFHFYGSECSADKGCLDSLGRYMVFTEMTANWTVPEPPKNHTSSDPNWNGDVTLSWWPGIQGAFTSRSDGQSKRVGYVMQPVVEYNALHSTGPYADRGVISSYNCCVGNFAWHSPPIPVKPGDKIYGKIYQIAPKVYDITTMLVSTGEATTLRADFREVEDWTANHAMVLAEGYGVSDCEHLAGGAYVFSSVTIVPSPPAWTEYTSGMTGWPGGTCGRYAVDSKITEGSQRSPANGIVVIGFSEAPQSSCATTNSPSP